MRPEGVSDAQPRGEKIQEMQDNENDDKIPEGGGVGAVILDGFFRIDLEWITQWINMIYTHWTTVEQLTLILSIFLEPI